MKYIVTLSLVAVVFTLIYFGVDVAFEQNVDLSEKSEISVLEKRSDLHRLESEDVDLNFKPNPLRQASLLSSDVDVSEVSDTKELCNSTYIDLSDGSVEDFLRRIYAEDFTFESACTELIEEKVKISISEFRSQCKNERRFESDCIHIAFKIRSHAIDMATGSVDPSHLSAETIVNKLYAKRLEDWRGRESLEYMIKLVGELEKRAPDLGFSKMKATLLEEISAFDESHTNDFFAYADRLYQEIPDEGLMLYHKYYATREYIEFTDIAESHLFRDPSNTVAKYLLAVTYYSVGKREKAATLLDDLRNHEIKDSLIASQVSQYFKAPDFWKPMYPASTFSFTTTFNIVELD